MSSKRELEQPTTVTVKRGALPRPLRLQDGGGFGTSPNLTIETRPPLSPDADPLDAVDRFRGGPEAHRLARSLAITWGIREPLLYEGDSATATEAVAGITNELGWPVVDIDCSDPTALQFPMHHARRPLLTETVAPVGERPENQQPITVLRLSHINKADARGVAALDRVLTAVANGETVHVLHNGRTIQVSAEDVRIIATVDPGTPTDEHIVDRSIQYHGPVQTRRRPTADLTADIGRLAGNPQVDRGLETIFTREEPLSDEALCEEFEADPDCISLDDFTQRLGTFHRTMTGALDAGARGRYQTQVPRIEDGIQLERVFRDLRRLETKAGMASLMSEVVKMHYAYPFHPFERAQIEAQIDKLFDPHRREFRVEDPAPQLPAQKSLGEQVLDVALSPTGVTIVSFAAVAAAVLSRR